MKNPLTDKGISTDTVGMLYLIRLAYIDTYGREAGHQLKRSQIEHSMGLKLGLDQHHEKAITRLAKAGYIRQEARDGITYISLL